MWQEHRNYHYISFASEHHLYITHIHMILSFVSVYDISDDGEEGYQEGRGRRIEGQTGGSWSND